MSAGVTLILACFDVTSKSPEISESTAQQSQHVRINRTNFLIAKSNILTRIAGSVKPSSRNPAVDFMQPENISHPQNILTPTDSPETLSTSQYGFSPSSGDLRGHLDDDGSVSGESSSTSEPRSPGGPEEQLARLSVERVSGESVGVRIFCG